MLQFIYEFLPLLLFFLTFKWYGIYGATAVGILSTFFLVLFHRVFHGRWDKKQCVVLAIFALFGGLTIYFHDPIFVKWKPSIVFWLFAFALWISRWFSKKSILASMMDSSSPELSMLPSFVWRRMEYAWISFLTFMGALNLWVVYQYSDAVWVNFKFYGSTICLFVFVIIQAFYLSFHIEQSKKRVSHDG